MTSTQIDLILTELDTQFTEGGLLYGPDIWLEAEYIGSIILSSNESIYPDDTMQIMFDSTNSILFTRKGHYEEDVFIEELINAGYDYEMIVGINLVRSATRKSPYKVGKSI